MYDRSTLTVDLVAASASDPLQGVYEVARFNNATMRLLRLDALHRRYRIPCAPAAATFHRFDCLVGSGRWSLDYCPTRRNRSASYTASTNHEQTSFIKKVNSDRRARDRGRSSTDFSFLIALRSDVARVLTDSDGLRPRKLCFASTCYTGAAPRLERTLMFAYPRFRIIFSLLFFFMGLFLRSYSSFAEVFFLWHTL